MWQMLWSRSPGPSVRLVGVGCSWSLELQLVHEGSDVNRVAMNWLLVRSSLAPRRYQKHIMLCPHTKPNKFKPCCSANHVVEFCKVAEQEISGSCKSLLWP